MEPLDEILRFLDEIGIDAREGAVPEGSFLPGVRIAGRSCYRPGVAALAGRPPA
ncbi:MAG TPA: hypothetical protein VLT89_16070 [Usitatibacter sp.]|nr:hypothetical protein [Usitatibacter sp.]